MPHLIRFKRRKNIAREYAYIYVNVAVIHSVLPHEDGSLVCYGNTEEVYVEHKPGDIVLAIESDDVSVTDGLSVGD